jgi:hypothetical protein
VHQVRRCRQAWLHCMQLACHAKWPLCLRGGVAPQSRDWQHALRACGWPEVVARQANNEVNELAFALLKGVVPRVGGANMVPSGEHPMTYHSRTYAPAFRPHTHSRQPHTHSSAHVLPCPSLLRDSRYTKDSFLLLLRLCPTPTKGLAVSP